MNYNPENLTQEQIKALAREVVGDGAELVDNMFFVTYGPYVMVGEGDDSDFELIDGFNNKTDIFTYGPYNSYEYAKAVYDDIDLDYDNGVGQVFIEDRRTGTITEKYLRKVVRVEYVDVEYNDAKLFNYVK